MYGVEGMMVSMIVILAISFVLFLVLREFYNWYFKINERRDLLKEQNELLKQILMKMGGEENSKNIKADIITNICNEDKKVQNNSSILIQEIKEDENCVSEKHFNRLVDITMFREDKKKLIDLYENTNGYYRFKEDSEFYSPETKKYIKSYVSKELQIMIKTENNNK